MKNTRYWAVLLLIVSSCFSMGCPKTSAKTVSTDSEHPLFFVDREPGNGPWRLKIEKKPTFYIKIYGNKKKDVAIIANFSQLSLRPIGFGAEDTKDQQALAENFLNGFCSEEKTNCVLESSEVVTLEATNTQYIRLRFKFDIGKEWSGLGIIYYRFDSPIEKIFILLAPDDVFAAFEQVFIDYMGTVEFKPGNVQPI